MIFNFKTLASLAMVSIWLLALPLDAEAKKKRKTKRSKDTVEQPAESAPAESAVEDQEVGAASSPGYGYDDEIVAEDAAEDAPYGQQEHPVVAKWTDKLVFSTENDTFRFRPKAAVQPVFRLVVNPSAKTMPPAPGSDYEGSGSYIEGSGFTLKRARVGFDATLFKRLRLYLDSDWGSEGTGRLVDFFADLDFFGGKAVLRAGYFTPWLGRQALANQTQLQMIEYAQAWEDERLGLRLGRDLGVSVFGMLFDGLEYGVGVWNGDQLWGTEGDSELEIPGNIDFMVGGRVAVHPLAFGGGKALPVMGNESPWEFYEKPGLAIGFAAFYNKTHDNLVPINDFEQVYYTHQFKMGVDLAFQYKGFSVTGEYFLLSNTIQDDTPSEVKEYVRRYGETMGINTLATGMGAYGQLGYFIIKDVFEVSGRFDYVDENTDVRGTRFYPGVGATWYVFGNNLKAQFMYRLNAGSGYNKEDDPGWIPTSNDFFLMIQAAI